MKLQLQFVLQHVITETTTSCNENLVVVLSSDMLSQKRQQVAMKMQLQFVFQHVITETTTSCNENVVVVCLPTCYHRNDNKLQWKFSYSLSSNTLSQKRQQVAMKMQLQFVFQHVLTETTTSCNENIAVVSSSNMISQKRQHVAMNMQLQFVFQQVITETTTSFNENVVVVCLPTCNHRNDNKLQWICSCSLSYNLLSQKRQQVAMKLQLQFLFQHVITKTTTSCKENVVAVCLPTCYHRNYDMFQ